MKTIVSIICFFIVGLGAVTAQEWQTDFTKAKEIASKENRPIILVFQGSDWCAPCIKLDKKIWSTEAFQNYAKEHYVMLQADFPRKRGNKLSKEQTEANNALAAKYNQQGYFPFVVVLDSQGTVLGQTSYKDITPEEYIEELNAFTNKF